MISTPICLSWFAAWSLFFLWERRTWLGDTLERQQRNEILLWRCVAFTLAVWLCWAVWPDRWNF